MYILPGLLLWCVTYMYAGIMIYLHSADEFDEVAAIMQLF